jgi:tRNA dimethylallyltransferase
MCPPDFLSDKPLPLPVSLSNRAAELLQDTGKSVKYVHRPHYSCRVSESALSPGDVLRVQRKLVCPTCSVHPEQPVMIDEGDPWDVHRRTKAHRRLAAKHARVMPSCQPQQEEQQPVE